LKCEDYPDPQPGPGEVTKTFVSHQDPASYLYAAQGVLGGRLEIPIAKIKPLAEAAQAHATVAKGGVGKILLES
jgi:NADPH:quinone reductase-like Zn-dependent oxidoreductase